MKKLTTILALAGALCLTARAQSGYVSFNEPTNAVGVGIVSYNFYWGMNSNYPTTFFASVPVKTDRTPNQLSPCLGVMTVSNSVAVPETVPSGAWIFGLSVTVTNGTSGFGTNGCFCPVQWIIARPPEKPVPPSDLTQH